MSAHNPADLAPDRNTERAAAVERGDVGRDAYVIEWSREIRYPRVLSINLKDSVEDDQFLA